MSDKNPLKHQIRRELAQMSQARSDLLNARYTEPNDDEHTKLRMKLQGWIETVYFSLARKKSHAPKAWEDAEFYVHHQNESVGLDHIGQWRDMTRPVEVERQDFSGATKTVHEPIVFSADTLIEASKALEKFAERAGFGVSDETPVSDT